MHLFLGCCGGVAQCTDDPTLESDTPIVALQQNLMRPIHQPPSAWPAALLNQKASSSLGSRGLEAPSLSPSAALPPAILCGGLVWFAWCACGDKAQLPKLKPASTDSVCLQ